MDALAQKLTPVFVNGVKLPLPIVTQMVKKALTRIWSRAPKDRNELVCWFTSLPGTRFRQLLCNTNGHHFEAQRGAGYYVPASKKMVQCYYNCFLTKGEIAIAIIRYVNAHLTRARILSGLLLQAPKPDASYSLRVAETVPMLFPEGRKSVIRHTPVYVTFVIQDGALSDVELTRRANSHEFAGGHKFTGPAAAPSNPELAIPLCDDAAVSC